MTMTLSGDGTITGLVAGGLPNATVTADDLASGAALNSVSDGVFFRNRVINGDMRIAQRGTGAVTTSASFAVDRFRLGFSMDGACSAQQDTSAPAGFVNSLKFTTTTADTDLGTSQAVQIQHRIEGTNVADLGWGAAGAQSITLSFWVRSSLTGTFGGAVQNSASDRSYPFTYTISAADTWEQKSITVPGDTTGTWLTTTGLGIRLCFTMGSGSNFVGTAGSWAGADYITATGATSVVGTLNATWYITGVQLEVGSVATPFERRPYGMELALCQRYYSRQGIFGRGNIAAHIAVPLNVNMRTTPSVTTISSYTGDGAAYTVYTDAVATNNFDVKITWTGGGSTSAYQAGFGASAEL